MPDIIRRQITIQNGKTVEIPPDAPADLRTWSSYCVFIERGNAVELDRKGLRGVTFTAVDGGARMYGSHHDLGHALLALGLAAQKRAVG